MPTATIRLWRSSLPSPRTRWKRTRQSSRRSWTGAHYMSPSCAMKRKNSRCIFLETSTTKIRNPKREPVETSKTRSCKSFGSGHLRKLSIDLNAFQTTKCRPPSTYRKLSQRRKIKKLKRRTNSKWRRTPWPITPKSTPKSRRRMKKWHSRTWIRTTARLISNQARWEAIISFWASRICRLCLIRSPREEGGIRRSTPWSCLKTEIKEAASLKNQMTVWQLKIQ